MVFDRRSPRFCRFGWCVLAVFWIKKRVGSNQKIKHYKVGQRVVGMLPVTNLAVVEKSPFLGALFEGFIAAEIVKAQLGAGRRRNLYYFRDHQGLEVDFVVPLGNGRVRLVEAKATRTPIPAMAEPMLRLAAAWNRAGGRKTEVDCILVHRPSRGALQSTALAPGAQAVVWQEFVDSLTM